MNFGLILWQAGWIREAAFFNYRLPLKPFRVDLSVLADFVFLLAMLAFLIRRFALASAYEERLANDMEAARQVQQVLVPETSVTVAGFVVESVYLPAESVGGDFFQQIPDGSGGVLIVVGDVSGKGLRAAMVVSMLVGAIGAEARHGHDPAALLAALNERMLGRAHGGFATCLAAHISADGELTVANAGHLAPYLNAGELEMPGSLPLGIAAGVDYETMKLRLVPRDRLTFLSDGVVEAQTTGGEMFGFERSREISGASAERIAQAAKDFGQNDDITVVTLAFAGGASAAAV